MRGWDKKMVIVVALEGWDRKVGASRHWGGEERRGTGNRLMMELAIGVKSGDKEA